MDKKEEKIERDEILMTSMSYKTFRRLLKKTLIYLYEHLDHSNTRVIDELLKNHLKVNKDQVDKWFKKNNILITDYLTMYDKDFKREVKKIEERFEDETIIIFKKSMIKKVKNDILN